MSCRVKPKNTAIIFAGGVGQRMNMGTPKQFVECMGKPIIIRTAEHFNYHPEIDAIIIVVKDIFIERMNQLLTQFPLDKVVAVIAGGDTAMDSIYNGLSLAAKDLHEDDIVLIHDGVRPFITPELISENIAVCREKGSCVSVGLSIETPIILKDGEVEKVLKRSETYVAKAPQTYHLKEVLEAHDMLRSQRDLYESFVDNCSMMKHLGKHLGHVVSGSENIKVTTKIDLYKMLGIANATEYEKIFASL